MGLCVWNTDNSIRTTLFPAGRRHGLGPQNPTNPCDSVSGAPSPGGFSTGWRHGLGAPKPANPSTSVPGAPSPPSDERRKEMNGGPVGDLRSSLLIFIIPKRKELSGGPASAQLFTSSFQKESNARRPPRITSHHIKRKELTTNAPIVPRSSSILIFSSQAGLFLPYHAGPSCPAPFCLTGPASSCPAPFCLTGPVSSCPASFYLAGPLSALSVRPLFTLPGLFPPYRPEPARYAVIAA